MKEEGLESFGLLATMQFLPGHGGITCYIYVFSPHPRRLVISD